MPNLVNNLWCRVYTQKQGFTLIEILITVAILALISVVSIPNFRKFSDDSTLTDATAYLAQLMRQAQSNAQSGVTCPSGVSSTAWQYVADTNQATLRVICSDLTTANKKIFTLPTGVTKSSTTPCHPQVLVVEFTKSQVDFYCGPVDTKTSVPGNPTSVNVVYTYSDSNSTIIVNKGGLIKTQ